MLFRSEAAVKQHLLRLYQKFRIPEGQNRRVRLANEVIALGLVRPLPPAERADRPVSADRGESPATGPVPGVVPQPRRSARPADGFRGAGQPNGIGHRAG